MYCVQPPALRLRSLLILAAALLTASCAQQQIQFQSNGFNRAIEQTTNELLLLNIVRSSKDLPIYFTKLTGFTGGNMLSGTVAPRIPFGPQAVASYDLGLSTQWSSGVSSMQFADLNQQEGLNGLRTPIDFYVLDRYGNDNYPFWVLATLMFESFEVSSPINTALLNREETYCRANKKSSVCEFIAYIKKRCGDRWISRNLADFYGATYGAFVTHRNSGKSECGYLRFQSFIALLGISGFVVDTLPTEEKDKAKATRRKPKGKSEDDDEIETKKKPRPDTKVRFLNNPTADDFLSKADKELEKYFREKRPGVLAKHSVNPTMRSPKRMIEFLGELTAAQNYAENKFQPMTLVPAGGDDRAPFFTVTRGVENSRGAALVIRDPQGEVFSIPAPKLGAANRDHSMVVLSIVNDLVNASTSKGAYPAPSIVEFRSLN
ncbi:MAG TPA: hypothetical protein VFY92_00280 [Hyphomicrobiaceae bacterium]|nr:hypothetical protein [Hyphomicrobiaceae bacterium]